MEVQHVLTAGIDLPPENYGRDQNVHSFYRRFREAVEALPGVEAAGFVSDLPLKGENNNNPATAGDRAAPPVTEWPMTNYRSASASYFKAAGIPLKDGHVFEERGSSKTEVMISDTLAARLWPGESAAGHLLRIYGNKDLLKVTGVVGSVHAASLTQDPTMMVYFPDWRRKDRNMSLVVRTANEPEGLIPLIRRAALKLEPGAAMPSIHTMREILDQSMAQQRFETSLLLSFAAMALILACLGIYGVLAFATGRRTSEIGIRMALGARPARILRATLASGMMPVAAGVAVGLSVSAALGQLIESLLFRVHAVDPMLYAGTAVFLLAVAAASCFLPARRAAALSPLEALRHE